MAVVTPLYGHTSQETAYMVSDYPYGRMRCKIWFWLEYREGKGYRFCSVTENPKNGRMNAPKKGTYHLLAANMYLDENGHCTYDALNEYSNYAKVSEFIANFPNMENVLRGTIRVWCKMKVAAYQRSLDNGKNVFGQPLSESEKEDYARDVAAWSKCVAQLSEQKSEG